MAIAKMTKVTLVSSNRHKEVALDALQELQNIEFLPLHEVEAWAALNEQKEVDEEQLKILSTRFERITHAIRFLESKQKQPSFIEKYKKPRENFSLNELNTLVSSFHIEQDIHQVETYQKQLRDIEEKRKALANKEELLRKWSHLKFVPSDLSHKEFISGTLATVPQTVDNYYIDLLEESSLLYVTELYHTKEEIGVFVSYSRKDIAEAFEELLKAHAVPFHYGFKHIPSKELEIVLAKTEELVQREKELKDEMTQQTDLTYRLKLESEVVYNELEKLKSHQVMIHGQHLFILQGWLEVAQLDRVRTQLEHHIPQAEYAFMEEEIVEEEYDQVPTVLNNSKLVAPFESLTEMYGLPKYGQLDPTPFTMPFYMTFFGMMSGDIGYGLLLWGATLFLLKGLHLEKGFKKSIELFHLLSYPTMMWGVLFGSFFGVNMPFQPLSLTTDLISIMILSVSFGIIQILVGLAIGAYTNIKQKAYADALSSNLAWIGIIVGLLLYAVGEMLLHHSLLSSVGVGLAIVSAILVVAVAVITSSNKLGGLASGLYNLYGISSYVGDIVSYTRLMALAVSGGSIASAFNTLIGYLPPVMRFTLGIVIIIGLHGLNIFLTYLGAYVHGLRLQFVEYYGKFYTSGGRKMEPFKTYEKYIDVVEKNNLKNQKES